MYEVYKVGEHPHWVEGLDLLATIGLHVALIPHYDNAEGGTHDTRFCYLGEERLAALEHNLPDGAFVLGVDEHTALCVDLEAWQAAVVGRGGVTVRVQGRSVRIEAGEKVPFDRIPELAADLASGGGGTAPTVVGAVPDAPSAPPGSAPGGAGSPLLAAVRTHEEAFRAARRAKDPSAMVAAVLALDDELWSWTADTLQSDEMDRGRASLRAMVADLGRVAELGDARPGHGRGALRRPGHNAAGHGAPGPPVRRRRHRPGPPGSPRCRGPRRPRGIHVGAHGGPRPGGGPRGNC